MKPIGILLTIIFLAIATPFATSTVTNFYTKVLFKSNSSLYGAIGCSNVLNDVLYFGSEDGNFYSYTPAKEEVKTIAVVDTRRLSSSHVLNKELYIGANDGILYKTRGGSLTFVAKVNTAIYGVTSIDNMVYFGTANGTLYEYNPVSAENKNVTYIATQIENIKAGPNKKIYIGAFNNNLYEFDPASGEKRVVLTKGSIVAMEVLRNKLYFGSNSEVYDYDFETGESYLLCSVDLWVLSMISWNNKIYIGTGDNGGIRVYDPANPDAKCPFVINDKQSAYTLTTYNNKLYFGTYEKTFEEYSEESDIEDEIGNTDLKEITSNSANSILNELHYLNPNLNISLVEVGAIKENSALVQAKKNNNVLFGEVNVTFTVPTKKTFDVVELLKKATFFALRNTTNGVKVGSVLTNNIQYSDVIATKLNDTTVSSSKSTCFGSISIQNNQNSTIKVQTPGCRYTYDTTLINEISVGYIGANNEKQAWADLLGMWPFTEVSNFCKAKPITANNTVTLTKSWDLTLENVVCKRTMEDIVSPSTVSLPANKVVNAVATKNIDTRDFIINLKQDISGRVSSTIITAANEEKTVEFTFKDLMKALNGAGLLPADIIINDDDRVTLQGTLVRRLLKEYPVHVQTTIVD